MRSTFLLALGTLSALSLHAQQAVPRAERHELTYIKDARQLPDDAWQTTLRARTAWRQFHAQHPTWSVEFNEANGLPHRAFGRPIPTAGANPSDRAMNFLAGALTPFGLPMDELQVKQVSTTGKYHFVHFGQRHQGVDVLFGHVLVKLDLQGRVVLFGLDAYPGITTELTPALGEGAASASAQNGLPMVMSVEPHGLRLLPVPVKHSVQHRLVHEVMVHTAEVGHPGRWLCWVDDLTGELLYRQNQIINHAPDNDEDVGADVQVNSTVYTTNQLDPSSVQGMPDVDITIGGQSFTVGNDGFLGSGISGPTTFTMELSGDWSRVDRFGTTASVTGTLQDGPNVLTFDNAATIQERSAYRYVSLVHDHCKAVLPAFTGMDFQLPTNVDVSGGTCNAYYDGSSINFYAEGGDCYSLANIGEVVWHEYGHGINDNFYQDNGGFFQNGGMNEGYADFWAFSISEDPILADGYNIVTPTDAIRRYDVDRKVFPVDLVGQVHSDGEIIAGAWWDTYLLLGSDMLLTTQLFAEAYPGLQADIPNGQEGTAFRDVLIDVLQADDTDGDLTNGTPNGNAIVEAFALHGITLISGFDLIHTPAADQNANNGITIIAQTTVTFPYTQYVQGVQLNYRINAGGWNTAVMTNTGGNTYEATIPGQPEGTVIAYYLGMLDINQQVSAVQPIGAAEPDPNVPYYILVGYTLSATEDLDNLSELGNWVPGQPGDNNTTGSWELTIPEASFSTVDNSEIQPGAQHTPGGELCFVTGNSSNTTSPGDNDVDGGHTTLQCEPIDLSLYENPTFTFWRWYTNSPPGGANPGADWWQVEITNDGQNWVRVENTTTSDRSWRRVAFRVQDHVTPNGTVQIRMIASDSIRVGQNLSGGSLVEAGVDDIQLWDNSSTIGIGEVNVATFAAVHPNPANDQLNISIALDGAKGLRWQVIDATGRQVIERSVGDRTGMVRERLDVRMLAEGTYVLRALWNGGRAEQRFVVVR
jgi:Zn-dependent metalloprotease